MPRGVRTYSGLANTPQQLSAMNPYQPPSAVPLATNELTCPERIESHGNVEESIKKWIDTFRSNATEPAIARAMLNREAMPGDGIWFECLIPAKPPLTAAENRRIKIYSALQVISYLACVGVYLAGGLDTYWFFAWLIVPTIITITARGDYARAAPAAYQISMWGWITADGIAGHLPGQFWNACWDDATKFELSDDQLHAEFPDGSGVRLTAGDIGAEWTELIEKLSSITIR